MWAVLLVPIALAGPRVTLGMRGGEVREGELLALGEDCTGTVRDLAGEVHHMSTEVVESVWFHSPPEGALPGTGTGQAYLQVQALAVGLELDVGGARFPVQAGQIVAVSPGRHRVHLYAPGCGQQRYWVDAPPDVLTPLVFNRPVERYFLPKAIGVGLVWGASMLMRFVLF